MSGIVCPFTLDEMLLKGNFRISLADFPVVTPVDHHDQTIVTQEVKQRDGMEEAAHRTFSVRYTNCHSATVHHRPCTKEHFNHISNPNN